MAEQSVGIKIGLPRLNNSRRVLHLETTACGIQAGLYGEKTRGIQNSAQSKEWVYWQCGGSPKSNRNVLKPRPDNTQLPNTTPPWCGHTERTECFLLRNMYREDVTSDTIWQNVFARMGHTVMNTRTSSTSFTSHSSGPHHIIYSILYWYPCSFAPLVASRPKHNIYKLAQADPSFLASASQLRQTWANFKKLNKTSNNFLLFRGLTVQIVCQGDLNDNFMYIYVASV